MRPIKVCLVRRLQSQRLVMGESLVVMFRQDCCAAEPAAAWWLGLPAEPGSLPRRLSTIGRQPDSMYRNVKSKHLNRKVFSTSQRLVSQCKDHLTMHFRMVMLAQVRGLNIASAQ